MTFSWIKWFAALVIITVIILFFILGGADYFSLDFLKAQQEDFQSFFIAHPWQAVGLFAFIYVLITALSLPGAAVLTLMAGALFGVLWGVVIVSFASSFGAMLAFLATRWLAGDAVQKKYTKKLQKINEGIEKEGAFYLFTLRLVPVVPFFLVNILMGLTPLKVWTFFLVSQLGMLPGTVAYVYAGTTLGAIQSLEDVLSIEIVIAFTMLGILPLLMKKLLHYVRGRYVQPV